MSVIGSSKLYNCVMAPSLCISMHITVWFKRIPCTETTQIIVRNYMVLCTLCGIACCVGCGSGHILSYANYMTACFKKRNLYMIFQVIVLLSCDKPALGKDPKRFLEVSIKIKNCKVCIFVKQLDTFLGFKIMLAKTNQIKMYEPLSSTWTAQNVFSPSRALPAHWW